MARNTIKKYFDASGNLLVKPYRTLDLSIIFDVNYNTLKKWISGHRDAIGERQGMYYSAAQVEIMLEKFGRPRIIYS